MNTQDQAALRELVPTLHQDGDRLWYTSKTIEEIEREHGPIRNDRIAVAADLATSEGDRNV